MASVSLAPTLSPHGRLALGLTRLMTSMLYEVKPAEPGVFVAVALALGAVAFVASVIPSLRATRVPPAVALRYE